MVSLAFGPSAVLIMCFGVFAPALHGALGWPLPAINLGASITSLAIMAISPVQGALIDRFGARRILLIFTPIFGLALVAMAALPPALPAFYWACLLLPIAGLGLWPLATMRAVSDWFDRALGLALGITNVGLALGATLLPLVLGLVFPRFGWRAGYFGLGLLILALVWPTVWLGVRHAPMSRHATSAAPRELQGLSLEAAASAPDFWITALGFLVLGGVSTGLLVHQSSILISVGYSPRNAIFIQAAVGFGSIVGRILTGWALDRTSVRLVGAIMFFAAGAVCAAFASPWTALLALPCALTVGLVIGAEFDLLGVLIRRYYGPRAFGRTFGIAFSAFQLGAAIGAAALAYSRTELGSYHPALLTLAGLTLIAGAWFLSLGPYRFAAEPPGAGPDAPVTDIIALATHSQGASTMSERLVDDGTPR